MQSSQIRGTYIYIGMKLWPHNVPMYVRYVVNIFKVKLENISLFNIMVINEINQSYNILTGHRLCRYKQHKYYIKNIN